MSMIIKGVHPYAFKCGEWAEIVGKRMLDLSVGEREVYDVKYKDGTKDTIPLSDLGNYEIRE